MILGQMLKLPPSRAWALVGSALVPTLLYWLAGLRKYLIQHCHNWGVYLEKLLSFINVSGWQSSYFIYFLLYRML